LEKKGQVFDLAIDNVGSPPRLYEYSHTFLKPSGKFVQVGANPSVADMGTVLRRAIRPGYLGGGKRTYHFVMVKSKSEDLIQIAKWLQEGRVRAIIDSAFRLKDVPKAYQKLRTRHANGKIIVHISEK
jgi:NADPH:quinone reductase-like Zn-dependent oxidoreductase